VADLESDQINLITSWPGTGREEGKAPTELFYEDSQIMWGYEIPADADPVRWFKLLLLKEEDLDENLRFSEFLLRGRKMLRENDKTAVGLIADYLRLLWKHILDTICKSRGESVVDALSFHVVITVPAIWKGYARQGMEVAARKSGILDPRPAGPTALTFAPEPEAAALSTLSEPGRKVKEGDVYVICDAGGGTVVSAGMPKTLRNAVNLSRISSATKLAKSIQYLCMRRSKAQVRSILSTLSGGDLTLFITQEVSVAAFSSMKPLRTCASLDSGESGTASARQGSRRL
jgi:hypothetical protein